jgi:lysophospholipase L1-like esterase
MRRVLFASLFILSLAVRVFADAPSLAHQRVLVLGDSITQDGRYVSFLEYYLHTVGQQADLISIGLSSETVSGLSEKSEDHPRPCVLERLDRALQAVKPTVVLACYGMNDGIYHPSAPERLAAFHNGLRELIAQVRNRGATLVLITPPVFDPLPLKAKVVPAGAPEFGYKHPFEGYDAVLAEFAAAEVALHLDGVTVIDLHTPMAAALAERRQQNPSFSFAPDGIHPGDLGHLVMARIIANGLGLAVPVGSADVELARIQADPLFALVRDRRELRSEAWLPFVGYTRNETYKSASVTAAEKTAARLQAEIDAPTANAKK